MIWNKNKNKKTATNRKCNDDFIDSQGPESLRRITQKLLDKLRGEGITADKFCEITGFHKNTVSKWKTGRQTPPVWIGFFFKMLLLEIEKNADIKGFLDSVDLYSNF